MTLYTRYVLRSGVSFSLSYKHIVCLLRKYIRVFTGHDHTFFRGTGHPPFLEARRTRCAFGGSKSVYPVKGMIMPLLETRVVPLFWSYAVYVSLKQIHVSVRYTIVSLYYYYFEFFSSKCKKKQFKNQKTQKSNFKH